jgi:hypothetical protein
LSLESIDNIERCDSLSLGAEQESVHVVANSTRLKRNLLLCVCDSITDDTLKEGLQDTSGLLVDHGRNTLDTTTTSETTDSGLGDTLDVVTKNLAMTLGTTLAEALSTFAASSHIDEV